MGNLTGDGSEKRAALVRELDQAVARQREAKLAKNREAIVAEFRRCFGRTPDYVDASDETATADGITLRLGHQDGIRGYWWEKHWSCPLCGTHTKWILDSLPRLGSVLVAERKTIEQHVCEPPHTVEEWGPWYEAAGIRGFAQEALAARAALLQGSKQSSGGPLTGRPIVGRAADGERSEGDGEPV